MDVKEALAWLRGERSVTNYFPSTGDPAQDFVAIQQSDAASTEQAYWVVRAHKEGLVQ